MELYIISGAFMYYKNIKMCKIINPLNLRWKSPPIHKEEEELHVRQGVPQLEVLLMSLYLLNGKRAFDIDCTVT